jgi:hypothetical protein
MHLVCMVQPFRKFVSLLPNSFFLLPRCFLHTSIHLLYPTTLPHPVRLFFLLSFRPHLGLNFVFALDLEVVLFWVFIRYCCTKQRRL